MFGVLSLVNIGRNLTACFSLNRLLVAAVALGLAINGFLCYERKRLEAENGLKSAELVLVKNDNQNLSSQLAAAHKNIADYQRQLKALHQQILTKLHQAENRTNAIISALDGAKNWRDEPIPAGVERLLNQRLANKSGNPTASAALPPSPQPLPSAKPPHSP